MLLAMEKEKKLRTFNVCLKNVSYMGVRLYEIEDTDSAFINYCSTFKRTFDTVELKITTNTEGGVGNNRSGQENDESVQDTELDDTEHVNKLIDVFFSLKIRLKRNLAVRNLRSVRSGLIA